MLSGPSYDQAFIGGFIFSLANLTFGGIIGSLVTALVGAIVLLILIGVATGKR